jgi:hypothetical protein
MRFHGVSVVIDDFNIMGSVGFPEEANAPLIVNADGVLPFAVALEGFQSVAGRDGKVAEFGDGMELGEFPQGNTLDVWREWPGSPILEEGGGFPANEGADHGVARIITPDVKPSSWDLSNDASFITPHPAKKTQTPKNPW